MFRVVPIMHSLTANFSQRQLSYANISSIIIDNLLGTGAMSPQTTKVLATEILLV